MLTYCHHFYAQSASTRVDKSLRFPYQVNDIRVFTEYFSSLHSSIRNCLSNIPQYFLSLFGIPVGEEREDVPVSWNQPGKYVNLG